MSSYRTKYALPSLSWTNNWLWKPKTKQSSTARNYTGKGLIKRESPIQAPSNNQSRKLLVWIPSRTRTTAHKMDCQKCEKEGPRSVLGMPRMNAECASLIGEARSRNTPAQRNNSPKASKTGQESQSQAGKR